MNLRPAILLLCGAAAMAAPSPWFRFLEQHQGRDPRSAPWYLCVREADAETALDLAHDATARLLAGGDLVLEPLSRSVAKDLWAQKSWKDTNHWVLLSPEGAEAAAGSGPIRGDNLLEAIHSAGGKARWEIRDAFLRDHPDHGEARLEALSMAFRILRIRFDNLRSKGKLPQLQGQGVPNPSSTRISLPGGEEAGALADELFSELVETLRPFLKVPGWQRELSLVNSFLLYWDLGQSSSMRNLLREASEAVEPFLRVDPYPFDPATFWMEARDGAGLAPESPASFVLPVPGRPWPPVALLNRLGEPFRRKADWEGLRRFVEDLASFPPPEPLTRESWEEYCRIQCAARVQAALALVNQGSWDTAAAALEEAKRHGGSLGVRMSLMLRGILMPGNAGDQGLWRQMLNRVLDKSSLPPPMPVQEPPLRLVLLGSPRWVPAWFALPEALELAPWSPSELRWEAGSSADHQRWSKLFGWGAEPRWALFRGEELRQTGTSCPDARALAAILEGEGPSQLQRLQTVVARQPDHAAARAARFKRLLTRMPDKRLEPTMAEDAALAGLALPFDPGVAWKPDADLWGAAAQKVLPKVEEELRSWPSRSALWNVWISWARFHPAHPSVVALAQSLPYWQPKGDWRATLPYAVHRAVAAEWRRTGGYLPMRNWFRIAWDGLDQRSLASLRPMERSWTLERRREEETAIFQPLRDALRALGCTQEQLEVERVFSAMVGREAGRR